ncbi:type II toxin-antitoxin system RelE/ParE family toxin [Oleisolibacter albus]|uniref:type II toxin-antitoxin system RelE/ParE family toxin n=1 Tax=Oleisolibacter albus TaxID=2171757 RepID=UPI000DF27E20|nr:type II toxin-antitoxin system RelE/ParE family toxin [Oleisolibacter albus]
MIHVRLTSAAEAELADALRWYGEIRRELAGRLLDEYERLLLRLRENPHQFPSVRNDIRRAGFRHFPYGLLFRLFPEEVEIIAVFHTSRDPRQWERRM